MGPRNRIFGSPNPLDHSENVAGLPGDDGPAGDPEDAPAALGDPLDQTNKIPGFDVRSLREHMRLTQRQFAGYFGFPVATLRHWERGNRKPNGTALVLLHVIRQNPRAVRKAVMAARFRNRWALAQWESRKSFRAPPGYTQDPHVVLRRARRAWGR